MLWLKESMKRGKKLKDSWSLNGIQLFVKDKLPEHIELDVVVEFILSRIPFHMMKGIDIIYIGEFEEMRVRDVNAYFEDGAIYLSNTQDNEMDIIDDIIHEIAHAAEREYSNMIYDGPLEREFLAKRARLYDMLRAEGYKLSPVFKVKTEYDRDIDEFLYKEIGYEKLDNLVNGLFISAYASTSLSEYFSRGFEEFYMGDVTYFKKVSPVLYSILESLKDLED